MMMMMMMVMMMMVLFFLFDKGPEKLSYISNQRKRKSRCLFISSKGADLGKLVANCFWWKWSRCNWESNPGLLRMFYHKTVILVTFISCAEDFWQNNSHSYTNEHPWPLNLKWRLKIVYLYFWISKFTNDLPQTHWIWSYQRKLYQLLIT